MKKECLHYEHDEEFNEHYCYGEECPEEYRITCKYEAEERCNPEDEYYGEFGLY